MPWRPPVQPEPAPTEPAEPAGMEVAP